MCLCVAVSNISFSFCLLLVLLLFFLEKLRMRNYFIFELRNSRSFMPSEFCLNTESCFFFFSLSLSVPYHKKIKSIVTFNRQLGIPSSCIYFLISYFLFPTLPRATVSLVFLPQHNKGPIFSWITKKCLYALTLSIWL